jgi:asparagine synthase (glutamine-hydrolysing)
MCGICGIWVSPDRPTPGRAAVEAMTTRIAHRGPDDAGVHLDSANGLALGFRRLSIIDLSAAGHQPMSNEDRSIWLVFNGEIYNFAALRSTLEAAGHRFVSRTDTEVILHGYEEWGLDVVPRLAGMFALALWDPARQRMMLARDRIGIKPLFYYRDDHQFAFGSEIKAVLAAPGIDRALDHRAVYDYLTYNYVPCPRTVYRHIRKLAAGHMLIVERDRQQLNSYWDVSLQPHARSEAEAVQQVQDGLRSAVRSHLVADVPVGVFLSGGMDSSAIAVEMAAATPDPIHTFSVGFDVRERSELPFARIVAQQIKSDHHEEVLSWPDAQSQLAQVAAVYDEPFADSSSVPTMAVSRLARQTVTVALSGEGGDEIFAGYGTYPAWVSRMRMRSLVPALLRSILVQVGSHWMLPRGEGLARTLADLNRTPLEQFARLMEWVSAEERRRVIGSGVAAQISGDDDYWYFRQYWREEADPITRLQYVDLKTYLADDLLVKVDRASMAVSLEARVPMLDHRLVETLFAIPGDLRFRNGVTKYLERQAMVGRLPASSLNRPKMGFTPPLNRWLSPANSAWARQFLERGAAVELGLLQPEALDRLSPRPRWLWASKVWVLLVLESWARQELAAVDPGRSEGRFHS